MPKWSWRGLEVLGQHPSSWCRGEKEAGEDLVAGWERQDTEVALLSGWQLPLEGAPSGASLLEEPA